MRRIDTYSGIISLIAGTGESDYEGDSNSTLKATMNQPYDLQIDAQDTVYTVNRLNAVIRKIDPNGKISTCSGTDKQGDSGDGGLAVHSTSGIESLLIEQEDTGTDTMTDLFSVKDRIAIVTGASGGLGEQFALTLARQGAKVALAARRLPLLGKIAARIKADGGEAVPIFLDITNPTSITSAVAQTQEALGPIAILVNNSGVVIHKPLLEHTVQDWEEVISVNLRGAYLMAQEVARQMVKTATPGSIINVASIIGVSRTATQIPEYLAAKGGLVSLTQGMATELARRNIRVNALAPGYIETDFNRDFLATKQGQRLIHGIPQRRAGLACELDGALLLLASDASTFMTGSVVTVDGGHSGASV